MGLDHPPAHRLWILLSDTSDGLAVDRYHILLITHGHLVYAYNRYYKTI